METGITVATKESFLTKILKQNPDLSHRGAVEALKLEFDSAMPNSRIAEIRREALGLPARKVKRKYTKRKSPKLTNEQIQELTATRFKPSKGLLRAIRVVQARFDFEGISQMVVSRNSVKVTHTVTSEVAT